MKDEGFVSKRLNARRWLMVGAAALSGSYGCALVSGLDEFDVVDKTVTSSSGGMGGMAGVSSSSDSASASNTSTSTGAVSSSSGGSSSGGGAPGALVIGEIYQAGGKQGADYSTDYVVLVNPSNMAVNIGGWALQHYKTGNGWVALPLSNASISAGGSYLIALYNDGGGGQGKVLPNPNASAPASSDWNLSTSNGEALAITNNVTVLNACDAATIVDLVGLNSAPPCKEGAAGAPTSTATNSAHRKAGETQDTNDNAADFELGPTSP